ncbi:MAG: nucleoside deaminase [Lactobacillaceae bacterium]|nr:nucleoside deaminase [Lactobacillaceae bacterium]
MTGNKYMKRALELARQAFDNDEVPIGAVVVDNTTGEIISEAYNLSQHSLCATAHAEMLAINEACQKLAANRLRGMDLYVTLEPCTMCAGAISFSRIENLYFGAYDEKGGAVENGVKFYEASTCHHKPNIFGGIMEKECSEILKKFFKKKRT